MQRKDSLQELTVFLQKNSGKILNGRCNLAFTTHTLAHLNHFFKQINEEPLLDNRRSSDPPLDRTRPQMVMFLYSYVQRMPALKLVHPTSTLHGPVEISRFTSLTMLEIKKVPLHMLNGLGCLRHQLQVLICSRCVHSLQSLLSSCGGDMLADAPWSSLHTLNLSYNHIDALDDSLRLLPMLKMLDVSHNNLKHTRDYLECLSELAHLNLGYNRLERVPSLGLVARTNLQTLVIRNNSLDNLSGLEDYSSLLELDLGNNCLYEGAELRTLGYLHNLREVNLLGNPLAFDPAYRSIVVSKLPHEATSRKKIPKVSLSKPLMRVPSQSSIDTGNSNLFNEISSLEDFIDQDGLVMSKGKKSKGKRPAKKVVRNVSIPDQDVKRDYPKPGSSMLHDSDIEDTRREHEQKRRQYGPDWLLALQAPYQQSTTPSASDSEKTVEKDLSKSRVLEGDPLGTGSSGIGSDIDRSDINSTVCGKSNVNPDNRADCTRDNHIERTTDSEAIKGSSLQPEMNAQQGELSLLTELHLETDNSKPSIFLERSESDIVFDSLWSETAPEQEELELCSPLLVILHDSSKGKPVHLFLTVKETHIEERDLNGHVVERLEIKCLKSMQQTQESVWSEETQGHNVVSVVKLGFDYIRRDRTKRQYTLEDDESYRILTKTLQPFLEENQQQAAAMQKGTFQCLKCSLEFSRHQAKRKLQTRHRGSFRGSYNSEEENSSDIESWMNEVPVCPSCNSDLIVELESPISISNHTSTVNTPAGSFNSVEMNIRPVGSSSPLKQREKDATFVSSTDKNRSGSSTEYHSANDSLSSSPAQALTARPSAHSSSSGTSTLVNSYEKLISSKLSRPRHISEETSSDDISTVQSIYQSSPHEGQNFALPDPTIKLHRGDETNPLENISMYQHEKLRELLQENIAPFNQKYSLVPSDILEGVISTETSGTTPKLHTDERSDVSAVNKLSKDGSPSVVSSDVINSTNPSDISQGRTKNGSHSLSSLDHNMLGNHNSFDQAQNGRSRPCSEDDIVILPAEKSSNVRHDVSFSESNDDPQDTDPYASAKVIRASSTDSEIAVLRNMSTDAVGITSDCVFDSSLNAAPSNLANALSDVASRPVMSNSSMTSLESSCSSGDKIYSDHSASDAFARMIAQSSSSKESSLSMSFEASGTVGVPTKHSMIDTTDSDFSNVDHRLKLFFSMSLFRSKEELTCMTKCRIFQFSKSASFEGLLVVSMQNIYIMKIIKEESDKPSSWLSKRTQHSIRDLLHIHIGPGSQSFQLDFNNEGVLYTVVMTDGQMCEAFVKYLVDAIQQGPISKKCRFKGIMRDHPSTLMNIMSQVFGASMSGASMEREIDLSLYLLVYRKTIDEVTKGVAVHLSQVSILVTPADIYLAQENHFWPLRQTKTKGLAKMTQFVFKEHHKITDVGEVELFEDALTDITIRFFHEDNREQSQWHIQTENTSSMVQLLAAIKQPWQEMFGVELKQTIHPSVTIQDDTLLSL